MAEILRAATQQSLGEVRQWDFDFSADLPTGATITGATAEHFPPSGSPVTPQIGTIAGAVVPCRLSGLTVAGQHKLTVKATYNNGESCEAQLQIEVIDL